MLTNMGTAWSGVHHLCNRSKMAITGIVIIAILVLAPSSGYSLAENRDSNSNLVVRHQHCALDTFAKNLKNTRTFDPNLLDKSVAQCETLLEPLKKSIIARTHDAKFAETIAVKIRRASKKGAAVAVATYFATQK